MSISHELMAKLTSLEPGTVRLEGDAASWAAFSRCNRYRYALGRFWAVDELFPAPTMLFILHNPSTADHQADDPTLRKCVHYAKRERCGGVVLANVMAYRSTEKAGLLGGVEPVGPSNGDVIRVLSTLQPVVVAWGRVDDRLKINVELVQWRISTMGPTCLGKNDDGSPKHPLYLSNDQALEPWP